MRYSILAGLLCAAAGPVQAAAPAAPDSAMLTVDGTPIRRTEVVQRLWSQYGNAAVNQMVDELLIRNAAAALKVKASSKEVAERLERIQGQFSDKETFERRLEASGGSLDALRAQLEEQVLRESLVVKAKKLSVSRSEVKDFFDQNKDRLGAPEAVRLRHILVSTEKEAQDFLTAVRAGADFAKLASQVSLDGATKDRGGDLGFVSKGMLQPEIEGAVFSLKPGETTPVVRTPAGYHIFRVEEQRQAKTASFKDLKDGLEAALLADKISKAWPGYLQELREKAKIVPAVPPAGR